MDPGLSIRPRISDGVVRLHAVGEVDLMTAASIPEELERVFVDGGVTDVVLDLREVTFMDSSGLRALLQAQDLARANHARFALSVGPGQVKKLLDLAGVADWFDHD